MFADGRLRGRRPDTGAVVEYATTTPGPGSGPPLPQEWTRFAVTKRITVAGVWAASYGVDGADYQPAGFFGNGVVAVLGWDMAALADALQGAEEVTGVELTLYTAALAQGPDITLGVYLHGVGEPPTSRPGAVGGRIPVLAPAVGTARVRLDPGPWAAGAVGGVLIDQGMDESLAGRVGVPADGALYAPAVTITYRAQDQHEEEV